MRRARIGAHTIFLGAAAYLGWRAWQYWSAWDASIRGSGGANLFALLGAIVILLAIIAVGEVGCRVADLLYDIGDKEEG